eukprot:m.1092998 g.1092998  ORF g.1092998 m.1092998 type:complete len:146 (+) comp24293_c0_seq15:3931-4368(+)
MLGARNTGGLFHEQRAKALQGKNSADTTIVTRHAYSVGGAFNRPGIACHSALSYFGPPRCTALKMNKPWEFSANGAPNNRGRGAWNKLPLLNPTQLRDREAQGLGTLRRAIAANKFQMELIWHRARLLPCALRTHTLLATGRVHG